MKKYISLFLTVPLCLSLTGCSALGGVSSALLVTLAVILATVGVLRKQSLIRLYRSRRMNRRQWEWLQAQNLLTNLIYFAAAVLLIAGLIVGIVSCGDFAEKPDPTDPPVIAPAVTDPTEPAQVTDPTEPSEPAPVTEPSQPTEEETEPDLIGIPESLLELMEKNPEATDFVLNYYNRQPVETDLSEFDREAGVPLFIQWDPRWGYEIYGSDVLGITGCGPTCVAMVGYYLTGDEWFTPDQVAEYAYANGYYERDMGTKWTFIGEGVDKLGMKSTELPLVKGTIVRHLEAGHPVIAVMGPGDFTTTGHYIVLVGYENGMFRVNDSNRHANSEKLWSYETLEPQIRNLWAIELG